MREADEETSAHFWQSPMAGQPPVIVLRDQVAALRRF
jgi:hypothetical protein